ncbi:MAG: hypothetical protein AAGI23_22105 [Bacteroidota bacterium]
MSIFWVSLYSLEGVSFETVFELSKDYFEQTALNIYLYSSQGDQARMNEQDGIVVSYGG